MKWLVLVESNTTGTGRLFAAAGRALGLRPVLLAANPDRYPYARRDGLECITTDTADSRAMLDVCAKLAKDAPVGAVLSSSEYFIAASAAIAGELGLPAVGAAAVQACRDKAEQRRILQGRVPQPRYERCTAADDVAAAAARLGGSVVVKPCQGTGSEGVRACADPGEAAAWAERLLAVGVNERGMPVEPRVMVEERVRGPEYSVELLDGQAYGVTAKHLGEPPYFVETGHDFPAPVPRRVARRLTDVARRSAAALGLNRGPAHVELRLADAGPVLIEVNPRLAGGMIPELVKLATGHDLIVATVASAAGRPVRTGGGARHHASIRFLTIPADGVVSAVDGLDRASQIPGMVHVSCTVAPGERRQLHHSFRDRVGHVMSVAETAAEAAAVADAGLASLAIRMEDASLTAESHA